MERARIGRRLALCLLAMLVLAGCGASAAGDEPAQAGEPKIGGQIELLDLDRQLPAPGEQAPDFKFVLGGREQTLSELRGKRVLINFWATWCGPCLLEMPDLNRVAASERDLVVLGVNLREDEQAIRDFAAEHGITFPLLVDPAGDVAGRYGVGNLPVSYFIDSEGRVAYRHLGAMTESFMRQKLEQIP